MEGTSVGVKEGDKDGFSGAREGSGVGEKEGDTGALRMKYGDGMMLALWLAAHNIHTCTVPLDGMIKVPVNVFERTYTLFLPVQYPPVMVAPVVVTNTWLPLATVAVKLNVSPATYASPDANVVVVPRLIVTVPAVLVVAEIFP